MNRQRPLCRSFRDRAREVQRDMDDAARLGLSRSEETITEDLLLRLAQAHPPHELQIKQFTRNEEGVHGADWEFWFCNDDGVGIPVRVQAKRLYPSGRYEALFHQSETQHQNNTNQCRELIRNARGSIPIYVFYNGLSHSRVSIPLLMPPFRLWNWTYSDWGISSCSAYQVRAARDGKDNRPSDIKMVPWHCLVCEECWSNAPSALDLPSLVGDALRQLFAEDDWGSEGSPDRPDYSFEPSTNGKPDWVRFLAEEEGRSSEALLGYMREASLRGVAMIEQPKPRD